MILKDWIGCIYIFCTSPLQQFSFQILVVQFMFIWNKKLPLLLTSYFIFPQIPTLSISARTILNPVYNVLAANLQSIYRRQLQKCVLLNQQNLFIAFFTSYFYRIYSKYFILYILTQNVYKWRNVGKVWIHFNFSKSDLVRGEEQLYYIFLMIINLLRPPPGLLLPRTTSSWQKSYQTPNTKSKLLTSH